MGAYAEQSQSLRYVQKFGPQLETAVAKALSWSRGRINYYTDGELSYDLQLDAFYPSPEKPDAFASVTYCKPDTPGHSNENKLQLKLGEMMLVKSAFPDCRAILVIGGNKETWLKYVLTAFNFFFDRTVWAWTEDFDRQILSIKKKPKSIKLKHAKVWNQLKEEWGNVKLWNAAPIDSGLRKSLWEAISESGCEGELKLSPV